MSSIKDNQPRHEFREVATPPHDSANENDAALTEYYTLRPNTWARWRHPIREAAAEFIGTMILVIFGNGVNCQVVLSRNPGVASFPQGDYLAISFGWGVGIALGVWISGGISGGHINPAVTLTMATLRRFPWKKVPIYMMSQLLGALTGAAIVYGTYFHAIDIVEGGKRTVPGTAGLFATYAAHYLTSVSAFFDEFLGTALLVMVILAVTDKSNLAPRPYLLPIALMWTLMGISTAFGLQTGFAINPARDLGPRLLTAMVGYGREVFTFRNQYWIWCPIMAPFLGGIAGGLVYDAFLFTGPESVVNTPDAMARAHHLRQQGAVRDGFPQASDNVV
ncbi:hypothetical protein M422DRAFT_45555 [Sphaerobolus stellatus SS14]|uniref:Aquaporin n=1 Tax=Sphaerobolus stellatus (strain SS14) TaxID=990650 RepID=A0A0C9VIN8_SPHS4|nr:hypothetical protein M422DRAFT_45555 [Sphaerobolus stellatus SS14]